MKQFIAMTPSHIPNYQIKINIKAFYISLYTPLSHFWTHLGKYGSFQQQQQFLQSYLPCPGLAVTAAPADGGSNSCQLQWCYYSGLLQCAIYNKIAVI